MLSHHTPKNNEEAKQKDMGQQPLHPFKTENDSSMRALFENHRKKRLSTRVTLKRIKKKNRFCAVSEAGEAIPLNGHYAYVTQLDGTIVAWPKSENKHNDTCHYALSDFAPSVAYAGEVSFTPYKTSQSGYARVREYNQASGTYKPAPSHHEQAGFPTDKFKVATFRF